MRVEPPKLPVSAMLLFVVFHYEDSCKRKNDQP
jgi:hypothetical protein